MGKSVSEDSVLTSARADIRLGRFSLGCKESAHRVIEPRILTAKTNRAGEVARFDHFVQRHATLDSKSGHDFGRGQHILHLYLLFISYQNSKFSNGSKGNIVVVFARRAAVALCLAAEELHGLANDFGLITLDALLVCVLSRA